MWSVGCILGELSDGQPLFPGESEIDQVGEPKKSIHITFWNVRICIFSLSQVLWWWGFFGVQKHDCYVFDVESVLVWTVGGGRF